MKIKPKKNTIYLHLNQSSPLTTTRRPFPLQQKEKRDMNRMPQTNPQENQLRP